MEVRQRSGDVRVGLGGEVANRSGRRQDETHVRGQVFDALVVRELGDASTECLVLSRQRGRLLERAAHVRAQLQDLHLGEDDSGQQDPEQRDPGPASDDAIEPEMIG